MFLKDSKYVHAELYRLLGPVPIVTCISAYVNVRIQEIMALVHNHCNHWFVGMKVNK